MNISDSAVTRNVRESWWATLRQVRKDCEKIMADDDKDSHFDFEKELPNIRKLICAQEGCTNEVNTKKGAGGYCNVGPAPTHRRQFLDRRKRVTSNGDNKPLDIHERIAIARRNMETKEQEAKIAREQLADLYRAAATELDPAR